MKKIFIYVLSFLLLSTCLSSCYREAHHFEEAETLFQKGLELCAVKDTEAAAVCFSQALLTLNRCDTTQLEVKRLLGQLDDTLGAMYWKHGLNDDALALHLEAVRIFRQLDDSALLMQALRNSGRVTASLSRIDDAGRYYKEALQIAKTLNDNDFLEETYKEMAYNLYLEGGEYGKAIETASEAFSKSVDTCFCHLVIGLANYYLENNKEALQHLVEAAKGDKANKELDTKEIQRIKSDYDLQLQKYSMQSEQRIKKLRLYLLIGLLLVVPIVTFLLMRQKVLKEKLRVEEAKNQMEAALKKNKVNLAALALSEQITATTLDFNLSENDWDDYMALIDVVYNDFTQKLLTQYPTLTKSDLQICCLTKQGFNNQVLAIIMNMQPSSYARRKSRIKQEKMNGLNDERSFEEIINEI